MNMSPVIRRGLPHPSDAVGVVWEGSFTTEELKTTGGTGVFPFTIRRVP